MSTGTQKLNERKVEGGSPLNYGDHKVRRSGVAHLDLSRVMRRPLKTGKNIVTYRAGLLKRWVTPELKRL